MFQSPTSAICARWIVGQPFVRGIPQRSKPFQLVSVVRRIHGAAVGHVQAPHPHPAAGRAQRPGLRRRFDLRLVTPRRLTLEADLLVIDAHPRRDRHTVPLVEPAVHHLVADRGERHGGELVVGALGLLHRQHVDVGALQPVRDPVDAGADGVHVPGGQPHALQPTSVEVALPVLNAQNPSTRRADRGGIVDQNLHVGTGRAALGAPGQQRRAQRPRHDRGDADPRSPAPPRGPPSGHRRVRPSPPRDPTPASPIRPNTTSPSMTAVSTSTGTSRSYSRSHRSSGRGASVTVASGCTRGQVAYHHHGFEMRGHTVG